MESSQNSEESKGASIPTAKQKPRNVVDGFSVLLRLKGNIVEYVFAVQMMLQPCFT